MLRPSFVLSIIASLTAIAVSPGNLGTVDAARRLQVTRSFWTGEPPVRRDVDTDFGIPGKNHRLEAWYGIGQSAVMLPLDMFAAALIHPFARLRAIDERLEGRIRQAIVAIALNSATTILAVYLAFH